ncbi:hypothetical protein AB1K70_11150 [Bremerella sp. JC770]|uniref:hypothetical protein n=1 Tax=Bremerella sp. JC770 TaxID=3232137 RepID=UPI003459EA2C
MAIASRTAQERGIVPTSATDQEQEIVQALEIDRELATDQALVTDLVMVIASRIALVVMATDPTLAVATKSISVAIA